MLLVLNQALSKYSVPNVPAQTPTCDHVRRFLGAYRGQLRSYPGVEKLLAFIQKA